MARRRRRATGKSATQRRAAPAPPPWTAVVLRDISTALFVAAAGSGAAAVICLSEHALHFADARIAVGGALAALLLGALVGLWAPRRLLRRRVETTPDDNRAVNFDVAASVAGFLLLGLGVVWAAQCAFAGGAESYRAWLTSAFGCPAWLTRPALHAPALVLWFVTGFAAAVTASGVYGWLRVLVDPPTPLVLLWRIGLLGVATGAVAARLIPSQRLAALIGCTAVLISGMLIARRRMPGVTLQRKLLQTHAVSSLGRARIAWLALVGAQGAIVVAASSSLELRSREGTTTAVAAIMLAALVGVAAARRWRAEILQREWLVPAAAGLGWLLPLLFGASVGAASLAWIALCSAAYGAALAREAVDARRPVRQLHLAAIGLTGGVIGALLAVIAPSFASSAKPRQDMSDLRWLTPHATEKHAIVTVTPCDALLSAWTIDFHARDCEVLVLADEDGSSVWSDRRIAGRLLHRASRALAAGGRLVILVPNEEAFAAANAWMETASRETRAQWRCITMEMDGRRRHLFIHGPDASAWLRSRPIPAGWRVTDRRCDANGPVAVVVEPETPEH